MRRRVTARAIVVRINVGRLAVVLRIAVKEFVGLARGRRARRRCRNVAELSAGGADGMVFRAEVEPLEGRVLAPDIDGLQRGCPRERKEVARAGVQIRGQDVYRC